MIVSHKHKFIFLKTNKTAGTSIEIALSAICGPDDIITPISDEDEATRQSMCSIGPQNYQAVGKKDLYNHASAKEVKAFVGDDIWQDYFKFCIERNPWDRVVSLYFWRESARKGEKRGISDFIAEEGALSILRKRGMELYSIDGEIAVDKVCRFEELESDLSSVLNKLGVTSKLNLPRAKSKSRSDRRSYREILSPQDKDAIHALFEKEIKLLNYEW